MVAIWAAGPPAAPVWHTVGRIEPAIWATPSFDNGWDGLEIECKCLQILCLLKLDHLGARNGLRPADRRPGSEMIWPTTLQASSFTTSRMSILSSQDWFICNCILDGDAGRTLDGPNWADFGREAGVKRSQVLVWRGRWCAVEGSG